MNERVFANTGFFLLMVLIILYGNITHVYFRLIPLFFAGAYIGWSHARWDKALAQKGKSTQEMKK